MLVKFYVFEPFLQIHQGHFNKVGYAHSIYFYISGFLLQSCSMTLRTHGSAAVSTHHDSILYLILILSYHLKEGVYRNLVMNILVFVTWQTVPQHIFFLPGKFKVWLKYWEIVFCSTSAKLFLPHLHLLSMPTLHTSVIYRKRTVGNNKSFVNAHNIAKPFTGRASSERRIE